MPFHYKCPYVSSVWARVRHGQRPFSYKDNKHTHTNTHKDNTPPLPNCPSTSPLAPKSTLIVTNPIPRWYQLCVCVPYLLHWLS